MEAALVEEPSPRKFREAAPQSASAPVSMAGAIQRAREEICALTNLPLDAITRSERRTDGGWTVVLDLVESVARMGDNDLLTTYSVELDASGTMTGFVRQGRYRREDGA